MSKPAEPITINRTLGIALSIIGALGSAGIIAGVGVMWSLGQSNTRMEANYNSMAKQIDYLTTAVQASSADRYTGKQATDDRTAILGVFNAMMDRVSMRVTQLIDANTAQNAVVADIRVKVATLEGKVKSP